MSTRRHGGELKTNDVHTCSLKQAQARPAERKRYAAHNTYTHAYRQCCPWSDKQNKFLSGPRARPPTRVFVVPSKMSRQVGVAKRANQRSSLSIKGAFTGVEVKPSLELTWARKSNSNGFFFRAQLEKDVLLEWKMHWESLDRM